MGAYMAFGDVHQRAGHHARRRPAAALDDRHDGARARRRRRVTDGPFAETREQLGGYYLVECDASTRRSTRPRASPARGSAPSRCARSCRSPTAGPVSRDAVAAGLAEIHRAEFGAGGRDPRPRVLGDLDLAEDAVQDAFATALQRWPRDGIPDEPGAWIVTHGAQPRDRRVRRQRVGGDRERSAAASRAGDASRRTGTRRARRRASRPDLRLLPPGAGARRARRADAAHASRADEPEIARAFLIARATSRSGWCGRSARSATPASRMRVPPARAAAGAPRRRARAGSTCSTTRATSRRPAPDPCAASCATRRSGWPGCWCG